MIYLVRGFGALFALGLAGLSVAMTFSFGMAFAEGADRYIYAGAFASMDGVKFLLPALAGYLALQGVKKHSRIARFLYLFFAILSASSHIGLTLMVKDAESSGVKSSQQRLADAANERDRLKGEIEVLKGTRSSGKIASDIAQVERDAIFTDPAKSAGCTNDTAPASRALCDRWRTLKGERDDRAKVDGLSIKLDEAQKKVDLLNTPSALRKANLFAVTLAEKTGTDPATMLLVVAIIMALGIEFGSSIMLELVAAAGHRKPTSSPAPSAISSPLIARNDAEPRANAAEIAREPVSPVLLVMCPKQWVASRLQPNKRASVLYEAALDTYRSEAEAAGMAPANSNAFSRALTTHGYERKRPGGVTTIMSAQMRADRPALAVVRAG